MKKKNILTGLPPKDREILQEMGNDLRQVALRPFMILFKIPANLLSVLYKGVCFYSVKIPEAAGRFLFLPLNLLISVADGLGFGQVQGSVKSGIKGVRTSIGQRIESIRRWFHRRGGTGRKLKLYEKTVSRYCITGDSPNGDAVREKCCYFFAFLLQCVSFFTTYAGLEMYFGGVFFLAPFLITLVIQGALYTAVVTVFKPGKRRGPMMICMAVFAFASILFSYTGLITLYNSPANDYALAYKSYGERFEQTRNLLLEDCTDTEQASIQVVKAMDAMANNLTMAQNEINVLTEQKNSIKIPPQFTNSRSVSEGADGTRTTTTVPVANPGYQESVDTLNQVNARISSLAAYRDSVKGFLRSYDADAVAALFKEAMEPDAEQAEEAKARREAFNQLETAFSKAAMANNGMAAELQTGASVDTDLVTRCKAGIQVFQELNSITFGSLEASAPASRHNPSRLMAFIMKAGRMVGADFGNTDMNSLALMRSQVNEAVDQNYSQMLAYENKGIDFTPLAEAKDRVSSLPGIMVFGLKRLMNPQSRSDAMLCLCLALFNDGTAILLGYAGAVRKGRDILKKKRRKVNDMDDLFSILYYSMQGAFIMQIQCGRFESTPDQEFEGICRNFVNSASSHINQFITHFSISACTSGEGYNRCWIYRSEEEIKDFVPFVSALMQAGILKIMPLPAYLDTRRRYDLGVTWEDEEHRQSDLRHIPTGDDKGYVLLLRNSGEEYMLRQLGYDFVADGAYQV